MGKKSYFTLALLGAVLGMSALSSCKDNNDDLYEDLRLEQAKDYADLVNQLDNLKKELMAAIDARPGQKGDKGDKGDTGATGPQGPQGEKGDKGDTGAQGEKGDKGDTGAQGEKGDKGDTGAQGEKGDKGDTGAQGEKGDKGDKGDTGATGATGASAYDDWCASDYKADVNGDGTINNDDFLLWLKQGACECDLSYIYDIINAITGAVSDAENLTTEQIASFKSTIKAALQDLADLKADAQNRINGIVLNATDNPVIGSINTPLGIKSTALLAYYGEAMYDLNFPGNGSTIGYLDEDEAIKTSEADVFLPTLRGKQYEIFNNDIVVSDVENNAGTLYVTVNPSTVNFEGKTLDLVNSRDEQSAFTLGALNHSNKALEFGWTRASESFYEVNAKIAPEVIEQELKKSKDDQKLYMFKIDEKELKDKASGFVSALRSREMSKIAETIYNMVNSGAQTYALKASYDGINGVSNVYSDYNIAAAAVNAPTFGLVNKIPHVWTIPGYERAQHYVNVIANKVNSIFNKVNVPSVTITHISLDPVDLNVDPEKLEDFVIRISTILEPKNDTYYIGPRTDEATYEYVRDKDGNIRWVVYDSKTFEIVNDIELNESDSKLFEDYYDGKPVVLPDYVEAFIVYDLSESIVDIISDVYDQAMGSLDDALADVNKLIDDIQDFLDDVNSIFDQLNTVQNTVNDLSSSVHNLLETLNNKAANAINKLGYYVKPALLLSYEDENGKNKIEKMLSAYPAYPTVISATDKIDFVATSMSAELIVPFVKKHVAVVKVSDMNGNVPANAQELADKVNTSGKMNMVFDGVGAGSLDGTKPATFVPASGFQAGYVYEIAYSVVDYAGYVSTRRYYVTVK